MKQKITQLLQRLSEVEKLLAEPHVFERQKEYRELAQEHSHLFAVKNAAEAVEKWSRQLEQDRALLKTEKDAELCLLLEEEIATLDGRLREAEQQLRLLLVPPDPDDSRNIIMELRAGTGGEEAALFVSDCVRMYQLYADNKGWKYETLSANPSDLGGFKEYIMVLTGPNVKRFLQYEAGIHRVQRVPETEAQGRIHTSAITIAVLLEPSEDEGIELEEKDLRIDIQRASGAGGQSVNTTDSAVRIVHLPTGEMVYCQDERSQHKNKEKALRVLKAKLLERLRQQRHEEEAGLRASQVGSGDRSGRSRTYNYPQNRITDHRIDLTLYSLDRILEGDLEPLTSALVQHYYQEKLSAA